MNWKFTSKRKFNSRDLYHNRPNKSVRWFLKSGHLSAVRLKMSKK